MERSRFTLRQLELFVAAARTGSFAGAAVAESVTAPAVSLAVGQLEQALGARLLHRLPARGVTLTAAGRHVLPGAQQLLGNADDLQLMLSDAAEVLRGPVSVGCHILLAPIVLPDLVEAASAEHPDLDLQYTDNTLDFLLPALRNGELDFIVTYETGLSPGLARTRLSRTQAHAVLAAEHPLARARTLRPQDLAEYDCFVLDLFPVGERMLDILHREGVEPRVRHRTWNADLALELVARSNGFTLVPQRPRSDRSFEGRALAAVPIESVFAHEWVVACWPENRPVTTRAAAVISQVHRIGSVRSPRVER